MAQIIKLMSINNILILISATIRNINGSINKCLGIKNIREPKIRLQDAIMRI